MTSIEFSKIVSDIIKRKNIVPITQQLQPKLSQLEMN